MNTRGALGKDIFFLSILRFEGNFCHLISISKLHQPKVYSMVFSPLQLKVLLKSSTLQVFILSLLLKMDPSWILYIALWD